MARAFGMTFREVMAMPHRLFLMHVEWLERSWNEPDRTDHYIMQLTRAVMCMFRKGAWPGLEKYQINFRRVQPLTSDEEVKEASAKARSRAMARFPAGMVKIVYAPALPPGGTSEAGAEMEKADG